MKKHKWRILLLVLVVILLSIVSSRVSPELPSVQSPSLSVPSVDDITIPEGYVSDDVSTAVTPSPTPIIPAEPEIELPDVSIHEWNLKLVNNRNSLGKSFAPDVSEIVDGQYFDTRAVEALNTLLNGARQNGFSTYVSTAYRPYSVQATTFFGKASQIVWADDSIPMAEAEMMAREFVAYPGTSEHQLGLAVDIVDSSDTSLIAEEVEDMELLVWLKEHCHEYGFILRYPKEKEEITGWYEPWHFRYVGVEAATFIMENGLCLEEFIELYKVPVS